MTKKILSLLDLEKKEIQKIINKSQKLKKKTQPILNNKTLISLFEAPSTRTRVSANTAMQKLGGNIINLDYSNSQISRGESLKDTARVLGLYADAILIRILNHSDQETIAENAGIPVINGLSKRFHPTQTISDLLTVKEETGGIKDRKIVYVGDCASNTAHSTLIGFTKLGAEVKLICPSNPKYEPDRLIFNKIIKERKASVSHELKTTEEADIIYTDVWVSMGFEKEREKRIKDLKPYQINEELLELAPEAKIMHCLPAHKGMEISEKAFNSPNSIIWEQAENKMHSFKGILDWVMT